MKHIVRARMAGWLLISLALTIAIWFLAPQQLPVSLYKLSLIACAAWAAYWIDRSLFPYARPDGYLRHNWRNVMGRTDLEADYQVAEGYHRVFAAAMLRRALIIAAAMISVALGA